MSFSFLPLPSPRIWTGRYARIPGKEPSFHVSTTGKITIQARGDIRLTFSMVDAPATRALAKALNSVKQRHAGSPGGSFQINEFGQVLAPIQGTMKRYWVGTLEGKPEFHDPRAPGTPVTLQPGSKLKVGDFWPYPYVGMPFTVRLNGLIHFRHSDESGERWIKSPRQDPELIARLRQIRGDVAIRFVVNLHGIVVTKKEISGEWKPVYAGSIRRNYWYDKEIIEHGTEPSLV